MNRFSAFPPSQLLLRILAAALAAAAVPMLASAQEMQAGKDEKDETMTIRAEQMTGRPDREVHLERDVEVTRGPMTINADKATYNILDDEVDAEGNIHMRRFGDRYTGDELKLKMDTGKGYVTNPTYNLERNGAAGSAERINFLAQDQASVVDGTYSTCEGADPDWYLKASTLDLDSGRDVGYARKAIVYFKGVPVLGTPAMSFPLSGARKSGFLPPTIGSSSSGGLEVTVPYYVNIAPNRDLTLFPKIYASRGFQWGAEGRYLGATYSGQTRGEVLFNDQQTKTNRYAISSIHTHNFAPGFSYAWNINAASDDNYPIDFPNSLTTAKQRLLPRDLVLNYADSSGFWTAAARTTNFQILQDPAAPIARPYDRLPQLTLQAGRLDEHGFDWNVASELTRFWNPEPTAFQSGSRIVLDPKSADRFVINPKIAYPFIQPGYFVTPKLSLHATQYHLIDAAPGTEQNLSRVLPTVSLDSGLVFEREAQFFGSAMTQTLEPRLFYVYTPFQDQSAFPNFDSALADLSFAQLFSENRFVGNDRIGDANQLTTALISRYIQSDGLERVRLALGQRFYFTQPRVALGEAIGNSRSDLLLSASGRLTSSLNAEGNVQYSQTQHKMSRSSIGARWTPAPKSVLNLQYRRDFIISPVLEQAEVSAQWPLARRWYGVGRVNYSLPDRTVAEGLLGVEYKADCWVFRVVSQRVPTSATTATSTLFFQLELNGLTRLGSNPLDALRSSIPGYQMVNQPMTQSGNP